MARRRKRKKGLGKGGVGASANDLAEIASGDATAGDKAEAGVTRKRSTKKFRRKKKGRKRGMG